MEIEISQNGDLESNQQQNNQIQNNQTNNIIREIQQNEQENIQPQEQNNENRNIEFNPPPIEDKMNQIQNNQPDNFIREIQHKEKQEQQNINDEVHKLKVKDIFKKIDAWKLGMQSSQLKRLRPDQRIKLVNKSIYNHIEKDLKKNAISKNEIEDAVDEKTIIELERLGYNENGYKIHDVNTSYLSRGSSVSALLDSSVNDTYESNELKKIETILKKYLITTNPPDDYEGILENLTPVQRINKVKQFYLNQAKNVQYWDFLPKSDLDEIIKTVTDSTLLLYGFDPTGKYIDDTKRKEEDKKRRKKVNY